MNVRKTLAAVSVAVATFAAGAQAADAKVAIRWEKLTVPFQDDSTTTAQNSSAVVSLGKLGRV